MRLQTVLCPIDFTSMTDREVDLGVAICRRFGARLVLHHSLGAHPSGVVSVSWMYAEDQGEQEQQQLSDAYLRFQRLLQEIPEDVERIGKLSRGPVEPALLHLARDLPADLILMGSHGWSHAAHRSVTEAILAHASCPVLTIRDEGRLRTEAFAAELPSSEVALVPVDLADYSLTGFDFALELLAELPFRLAVVHVEKSAGATGPECRERLNSRVPEAMRDRFELHVVAGDPAAEILTLSESLDAAVLVLGCHRKGFFERLFKGCTSLKVLHEARCPVWFVPEGVGSCSPDRVEEVAAVSD